MSISVRCAPRTIRFGGQTYPCRIGREGSIDQAKGREGDAKTPCGEYILRFGLYRPDRLPGPPPSLLKFMALEPDDGWCDDPDDHAYNRFIRLPYPASHERMWREDGAYDLVLVMNHNDSPPEKGRGSAVFIHIAQPDDRGTLGCIALAPDAMIALVKYAQAGMKISISEK